MPNMNDTPAPALFVHEQLFQRYYSNGLALPDKSASSHWSELATRFLVRPVKNGFELAGYGFGGSGSTSLLARIEARVGNALQLKMRTTLGLRRDVHIAKEVVARMELAFSQDAFRQVCTLNLLEKYFSSVDQPNRILVIGDGHGVLSALLHQRYPKAKIFLVDLGSVLFFQAYHLQKAYPDTSQALASNNVNQGGEGFNFCPADQLESMSSESFDLAINVASMQEMDPAVTAKYFQLMRSHDTKFFYCCNRLEKRLVGGEIARIMDYPWTSSDEHFVDEPCPWHQWFFGRGHSPHVTVFGMPIPFIHRYDGPHWHRLTKFGSNKP